MARVDDIEARHRAFYDAEVGVRARRPLGPQRERVVRAFADLLRDEGLGTVLEVGSGAGRDAQVLAGAGLSYVGLDLSPGAVSFSRARGIEAQVGSALALPFEDDAFDAAWSMSTLMHLPADGLAVALGEVGRVVRTGGVAGIGVWGHLEGGTWTDPHGRFFRRRTDDELRVELTALGKVTGFETWDHLADGGHYQWALVRVA